MGFGDPLFDADLVAVEASLAFNCGEFAIIKAGIVDAFPNAEKLDGVAVAEPVGNKEIAVLGFQHISQGNVVLISLRKDGNGRSQNVDAQFRYLAHCSNFFARAAGCPPFGARGFEPPTSWSQTRRSNQAELRPVIGPYYSTFPNPWKMPRPPCTVGFMPPDSSLRTKNPRVSGARMRFPRATHH